MSEKLYRILVVALLAIIAIAQIFPYLATPEPVVKNEACENAREDGLETLSTNLELVSGLFDDYQNAAYREADNINHQIFFASEFTFTAVQVMALQNSAVLRILANCP